MDFLEQREKEALLSKHKRSNTNLLVSRIRSSENYFCCCCNMMANLGRCRQCRGYEVSSWNRLR